MIKSLIPSFFQTNPSSAFPLVSSVMSVLSIFLLIDKISSQPKPQSVSSSVIPYFNEVIVATLLKHIDTLSLLMSLFLRTPLCSLPPTLPILISYHYPFSIPSRIPPPATPARPLQVYNRRPRIDTRPPADSSPMVPSSTMSVLPSPIDLPISIRKGTHSSSLTSSYSTSTIAGLYLSPAY